MTEPTKEQIQKFWEWCEFKQLPEGKKDYHFEFLTKVMDWQTPDGSIAPYLPPIDLNNLFKYAVPKLDRKIGRKQLIELLNKWAEESDLEALDLFWAIWGVINDKSI